MIVNIHKILYHTTAEGFGHRACIWLQGCSRQCKGCMARDTWNPEDGYQMDTESILQRIFLEAQIRGLEGVTFLGGEPFEQPKPLTEMICRIKKEGLSVIVFTGYTFEQLQQTEDEAVLACLSQIDLLIDGAYIEELREFERPWVGSSNQRYLFLTDRYSENDIQKERNRMEIRISKDGKITVNGMADFQKIFHI